MNNNGTPLPLSMSLFIKGFQCHKALYPYKYHPELKDPVPPSPEELFQSGFETGVTYAMVKLLEALKKSVR